MVCFISYSGFCSCFFFFSSRRRHTRLVSDWSSDVCSSDLVFVFIGFKPVGRYLFKEHIEHDKNGYLITDQYMRTSIPGVYAAGDTRAQLAKQITTAVGDATTAVLHAERYIEELKDLERAFPSE